MTALPDDLSNELDDIISAAAEAADSASIIRKAKVEKKEKESGGERYLRIEPSEDSTPIKSAIVNYVNKRNYTYNDFKNFCTQYFGDEKSGMHKAYNTMQGLMKRKSMTDKSLTLLMDFLQINVLLVPRTEDAIIATAQELVQKLKFCPERLDATLCYIVDEMEKLKKEKNNENTEKSEDE